jgi:hypothetical protein
MIYFLKKLTVKNAGFEIQDRGDCQLLSELIIEKTDESISYNTLRRFFGLDYFVKTSKSTLDTLARFNGYKNYVHYLAINPSEAYWSNKENLFQLINEEPEEISKFINQTDLKNEHALDFMVSLCRELIYLEKTAVLDEVLKTDFFNSRSFTYSEMLHFGNSIGILIKTKPEIGKKLLLNSNFLKFVYCIYVDYSNLNGYYGDWSEFVSKNNSDIQLKCFAQAILQLKNYLNCKPVSFSNFVAIDTTKFHPILRGRIYSIKILSGVSTSNDYYSDFETVKLHGKNDILWDYFYEPIMVAILSGNFLLMEAIIHILSNKKINTEYYQEHNQKIYKLMCLIFANRIDSTIKKVGTFENTMHESEFKFKYSYQESIALFVSVLNFHTDKINGAKHTQMFQRISKKLNYPLFSDSYLDNYVV